MAGVLPCSSSTLSLLTPLNFHSQEQCRALHSHSLSTQRRGLFVCAAKKKVSFTDQILDYIEGGPKLRKWYGAPELLPKDGSVAEDEDELSEGDETRDAVLVTDGDSEMGQSLTGDSRDKPFLRRALRGVSTVICPNEGFLSTVGSLKGVNHVILLSQLSVYKDAGGIQALMKSNARKLAEEDESILMASGIPYTIIRAGSLQISPGGTQGFSFEKGTAAKGTLSKEDAAFICVEAVDAVPEERFIFEVVNGDDKVSDWKECLNRLMEKS
ncbi:hypothetical protein ABKV19_009355 [Rosa sericea]